jgi:hypothetical protein
VRFFSRGLVAHVPTVLSRLSLVGTIAVTLFFGTASARAVNIGINLGPSRVVTGPNPTTGKLAFTGLNNTVVNGSISVDFLFTNSEFVRLFTVTQPSFAASINLQTSASSFLGFLDGTGYLIDSQGNAIPGFSITGGASGNDGSMGLDLYPLLKDANGTPNDQLQKPLDFYGVHLNLTFPSDPSVHVTGGQFSLGAMGDFSPFAVGPGSIPADIASVPDSGGTVVLLGIGVLALAALWHKLAGVRPAL